MVAWTLSRYVLGRFLLTVAGGFASVFALVFLVDFVEMFRRASGSSVGPFAAGFLSLLRTPAICEQAIPFAMLASAMLAFFSLSRRMELTVARAAGVSAWQFLALPLLATLTIGVCLVTLFNPLAAVSKDRADRLETELFGGARREADTSLWFRQRGIDGPSIMHADQSSDAGSRLSGVTAYVFTPEGDFLERIDAARAVLYPGFWELRDGRLNAPGEEPVEVGQYLLATNLAPEQATRAFVPPDSIPFWSLPEAERRSEEAGLDAHRYRLRFQTLLAMPVFLLAMVLIAASVSLRFFRSSGAGLLAAVGVAAGFVLYVATKIVGDLGGAGLLSAPVAAWSPAILGGLLGTLALLHQEDG